MQNIDPLRLCVKAALFFIIANLAFACFNPPVGELSLYNRLFPGRMRFPYVKNNDDLLPAHSMPVFENFDAMFSSTVVANAAQMQNHEYQIFFLGDSSMWGVNLAEQNTLVGQINLLNLQTCNGRRVQAYNLGYPLPDGVRDLLLLDKSKEYRPDLFVWFVTLDTFINKNANADFLTSHPDETLNLARRFGLQIDAGKISPSSFWDKTIIGRRIALKKIIILQADGLAWWATGVDYYEQPAGAAPQGASAPVAKTPPLTDNNKKKLLSYFVFSLLQAAQSEAGNTPLLIVNEPVQILSNKDSADPNQMYTRWAYDIYQSGLAEWMKGGRYDYMDMGASLSADSFVSELHRSVRGEQNLAKQIVPALLRRACP